MTAARHNCAFIDYQRTDGANESTAVRGLQWGPGVSVCACARVCVCQCERAREALAGGEGMGAGQEGRRGLGQWGEGGGRPCCSVH